MHFLRKEYILKAIIAVWVLLWLLFLVREDKDGQYRELGYLYTHDYADKVSYLAGEDVFSFLVFCRESLPAGSTYELAGFKEFSIDKVRMRYFLWPLRGTEEDADFVIVYGESKVPLGYKKYKQHDNGFIAVKRGR